MNDKPQLSKPVRISTTELERRWQKVRQAMQERDLDVLIMQNSSDQLGGYVRWFTDMPMNSYPATVIFPRDDEMTTIWHGARPPGEPLPPAEALRGVKKRVSVPVIHTLAQSNILLAESAAAELKPYANGRIGLVGMGAISASLYAYLTEHLNQASFEDATDMVDDIKAIKSDEEISLIKDTCRLQDELFKYTLSCVQVGRNDHAIRYDVIRKALELGSQGINIMLASAPADETIKASFEDRIIQKGDQFFILIEVDGPGGFWGEIARTICLNSISPEVQEHFDLALQAQQLAVSRLVPGVAPGDLWDANNDFMRSHGYPEERRIFAHGQGYDMVERPSLDCDETMKVQARMNISIHPQVRSERGRGFLCDNFLVHADRVERLHQTPQEVFVV